MCMEANCCAAIGNSALREDFLDRLAKTQGVMLAIIHLLENGSYWAQGHAARALGNLLPSLDNVKFLAKVDARNVAAHALYSMLLTDSVPRNKEHALHAIGNMVRVSSFCVVFNRMDGMQSTLIRLSDEGVSRTATDRITACLSQQRLGTRTWRPPTRVP